MESNSQPWRLQTHADPLRRDRHHWVRFYYSTYYRLCLFRQSVTTHHVIFLKLKRDFENAALGSVIQKKCLENRCKLENSVLIIGFLLKLTYCERFLRKKKYYLIC